MSSVSRCAVLGDPVAHSLSPVLHAAAYDLLGLPWVYDAVRVPEGGLAAFLEGLAPGEWRGLSVTAPLKREALALATVVSQRARLVGAANTLVPVDGGWSADNTDLPGAVAAVRAAYAGPVSAGTVLGAGATAASTGLALVELGARTVTLLARSPDRAAETAAAIAAHPAAPSVAVRPLSAPPAGEVLVSTIPASAQSPDLVARCADEMPVVFEVLYDPWPTPLARAAEAAGRTVVGGLDLLVHQAVLQVEAFTGRPAPVEAMYSAGRAALAGRAGRPGRA